MLHELLYITYTVNPATLNCDAILQNTFIFASGPHTNNSFLLTITFRFIGTSINKGRILV